MKARLPRAIERKDGDVQRSRLSRRIFAVLLASSLGLHAQSPDSNAKTLVRVHGVVVNAVTNSPIPHALVQSADQRMAVMSDDKGRFEFDVNVSTAFATNASTPYILPKKPGYQAPALPTFLPLDDMAALHAELRLQMMPEGTIAGTVVGASDEVPFELNVELLRRQVQDGFSTWNQVQNQPVDAQGRFRFGGLMPGNYKIVTDEWVDRIDMATTRETKPVSGYPPQFYPSGSSLATAATLHLGGGQSIVADLNLRGAKYYPVEVPVISKEATKFVQIRVLSETGHGHTLSFEAKSRKIAGLLPDGLYHITVFDMGESQTPGTAPETRAGTADLVVAGKPAHGAAIPLFPAATIPIVVRQDYTGPEPNATAAGAVLSTMGPIPDASTAGQLGTVSPGLGAPAVAFNPIVSPIDAFLNPGINGVDGRMAGSFGFNAVMHQDPTTGELSFVGVPPGRYRIQINPRRGYVASVTANGVDLLRNALIVESGAEPPSITITLRDDSGIITGTIAGAAGRANTPVVNYFVVAFPLGEESAAQPASGFSQADGTFSIVNVVPGRYLVVAGQGSAPSMAFRDKDSMKVYASQGTIADVTAGQTVTTSLRPLPRHTIYGDQAEPSGDESKE